MATRTRKQLKRERFLKIYFHYWKLQNNPEYIEYWKKQTTFLEDSQKDPIKAFDKVDDTFLIEEVNLGKRLGLGQILIDPFRKIDWKGLVDFNRIDPDIINGLIFSPLYQPVKVQGYHVERGLVKAKFALDVIDGMNTMNTMNAKDARIAKFKLDILKSIACEKEKPVYEMGNPILRLLINLTHDKKDILEKVSRYIDIWRKERNIQASKNRDQISKFHIYAQVWDLRKGFPKKSFREIARELRRPTQTVISQYKKADELINGRLYKAVDHKAVRRSLIRNTTCKGCAERVSCEKHGIPCPDVQIQLKELEISQAHKLDRLFFDRQGEKKSTYDLAADREAYRRWQQEESQ